MAAISSIPDATATTVIAAASVTDNRKAVWFQNYDTSNGIYVRPYETSDVDGNEFYIAPASADTNPTTLIIQSSGGDSTLVNKKWQAYQSSGDAITSFKCGVWL